MTLSYKILFSVQLLHEYFNKEIFTDCTIIPAAETGQGFQGNNLLMRFIKDQLYILIKEEGNKPDPPLDAANVFRFYLVCTNHDLFNYSNIDPALSKGRLLYLSNLADNKVGSDLNLTAKGA